MDRLVAFTYCTGVSINSPLIGIINCEWQIKTTLI